MNTLLTNAQIATLNDDTPYGLIVDGVIAIKEECIEWVGHKSSLPDQFADYAVTNLGGRLVTPALIDCHTHLIYGGNRAREFEQRLLGVTYEEIARSGGGIVSTVESTRSASVVELVKAALPRLDAMIAAGLSTIEIKSGYGLDRECELKMLTAARALQSSRSIRIYTSFLGAHAIPPEYRDRADEYIDEICVPTLREAANEGLVDFVDGFCENIAFSAAQIARVFDVAKELNLPVRLHAEQLSHQQGVQLAVKYGALCADHIEYANEEDAQAMASSGMIATLLPGAFYTLRETRCPPIEAFRKHGVAMAVATDANPGSSPLFSPLLAMNMACTLFRLTPEEALRGTTQNAARPLGLSDTGQITTGKRADLAVWDVSHPAELSYTIGLNPLYARWFAGEMLSCS